MEDYLLFELNIMIITQTVLYYISAMDIDTSSFPGPSHAGDQTLEKKLTSKPGKHLCELGFL